MATARGRAMMAALFSLVLAANCFGAMMSTEQVKVKAGEYVLFDNERVTVQDYTTGSPKPLIIGEDYYGYWINFYYSGASTPEQYSNTFSKVAISDDTRDAVKDPDTLSKLFAMDYEYAWERNYVSGEIGLSYADMDTAVTAAIKTLQADQKNLEIVRASALARTQSAQLESHFNRLDETLADMVAELGDLQSQEIANGKMSQKTFAETRDVNTYDESITNYNATFEKLAACMEKAEAFFALISDNSQYSQLNSDENQIIQKIYTQGLGTDKFYSSTQTRDGIIAQYDSMRRDEDAAVNNSVRDSLYRVAKATATRAYNAELAQTPFSTKQLLDHIKNNEAEYAGCSISQSVKELTATWGNVTATMDSAATTQEYDAATRKIADAAAKRDSLWKAMQNCKSPATATPTATAQGNGLLDLAIPALAVILLAYGYMQYQKAQKQKAEEEGEEA